MDELQTIRDMVAARSKIAQEAEVKSKEIAQWRKGITAVGYSDDGLTEITINGDGFIVDVFSGYFVSAREASSDLSDALTVAKKQLSQDLADEAKRVGMPAMIDDTVVLDAADA